MHGHNFADYVKCIETNDWVGVAKLMLSSAEKLGKADADFLIAPSTPCTRHSTWWSTVPHVRGCTSRSRSRTKRTVRVTSAWEFWEPAH